MILRQLYFIIVVVVYFISNINTLDVDVSKDIIMAIQRVS